MELFFIGSGVGILSGFFGIGGGTILIPLLLMVGFETKTAIGISIVQMSFASIFGSYLNFKKGSLDFSLVAFIAFGGFFGGFLSGYVANYIPSKILEVIFFGFVSFALARIFFKTQNETDEEKELNKILLFIIGVFIGLFSALIGVGGSILLIPILVGFLNVDVKKAISAGLFFVIFSSISGLISHAINGHIDYKTGIIVGLSSLVGVYIGIQLKHKVSSKLSQRLLVFFYLSVIIYMANRVFF